MKIDVKYIPSESKDKTITLGWYIIWALVVIMLVLFITEPTWFVLPPFVPVK